ncbi:MAG: response regulator [Synergistaceae bacterium]|jgi:signal transduction histidine kinase/DNA-binding response OmpR family regulator|nr:response regulator [Synergistaceae bacterium]
MDIDIADYIDEVVLSLVTKAINHVASIAELLSDINTIRAMAEELNAFIKNSEAESSVAAKSGEMAQTAGVVFERVRSLEHEVARMSMDINEIMGSVEDLNAARLKSDRENRSKTLFLARMSHELRTPMNAIIGMGELAEREYGRPECLGYIRDIKQAGTNLLSIINDILDFSRIESDNFQIIQSSYDTVSLFHDVIAIIRVRLAESPVRFMTSIDPGIPSVMVGDVGRIRQILLNLLSNAVKYTEDGFIKFSASSEKDGETAILRFVVEDSGIGIKPKDLDRLFGDFERFDMNHNTGIEGVGLGLSIARSLCRVMGGDISVTSEYGKGSVFIATLRQSCGDCTPIGNIDEKMSVRTRQVGVKFTAPGFRVLVVDDVEVNLKIAKGLLSPFKMEIDTCSSGSKALSMVQENEYDLVFMDHMMPGMDGIEAASLIRMLEGKRFHNLPIVALTANAISGMREMFLENGFNDFLTKPIEIRRLYELMERWVPREKRAKFECTRPSDSPSETILNIEGLDTSRGLVMTGGTMEDYMTVLDLYCQDAESRMKTLRDVPDKDDLTLFTTQVHALKSASASIGAAALSEAAAMLETAGGRGDMEYIRENLFFFRENLAVTIEHIKTALSLKP